MEISLDTTALRAAFARQLVAFATERYGVTAEMAPRLEAAFARVPREVFAGPPPWQVGSVFEDGRVQTRDLAELYQDVLVSLDAEQGINIGEPGIHAGWLSAVAPQPGEIVCQIGAGSGYYTALLAELVAPGGRVAGWEIDRALAARAEANLAPWPNAVVLPGDAVTEALPQSDLIYVCAGLAAPPLGWLAALAPGGRMIFPWVPSETASLALLVERRETGFAATPLMPAWFIACSGAAGRPSAPEPGPDRARKVRSLRLRSEGGPDGSTILEQDEIWFSSDPA